MIKTEQKLTQSEVSDEYYVLPYTEMLNSVRKYIKMCAVLQSQKQSAI